MTRKTLQQMKTKRLASMGVDERAESDETYAAVRLALEFGEKVRDARTGTAENGCRPANDDFQPVGDLSLEPGRMARHPASRAGRRLRELPGQRQETSLAVLPGRTFDIFEGSEQIQQLVISRAISARCSGALSERAKGSRTHRVGVRL